MIRRQTMPKQWFIADRRDHQVWHALGKLPRGCGVLVLGKMSPSEWRRLRYLATLRRLSVVSEQPRAAARAHNIQELRQALLRRPALVLLSPIFSTASHPDWAPLPRMRAAALARLAGRRLTALGGMDAKRYARIAPLGFVGWAGISAFRT
jgi:thiamine-phosphate pyrophosphorylase